jgi:S-adenosylmethionine:tRNA ribosyltransferase-isomerase
MKTALFDYELPADRIAQAPAARRDQARLMVIDRAGGTVRHHRFYELPELLGAERHLLVRNNANVIPARLLARRPTGGRVECLLLRPGARDDEWWCLIRPARRLPAGATFGVDGQFEATVVAAHGEGLAEVRFAGPLGRDARAIAEATGEMPLPPYIAPRSDDAQRRADRERYRTVFADPKKTVAVAAPTAGLHFTPELIARLEAAGHEHADLTLHVGLGTFRPIATEDIEAHEIHREIYEVPAALQARLCARRGPTRLAIGTTAVRAVEDFLARNSAPTGADWLAEAGLFIHPPAVFRGVEALITNFHAPRSTLLCLVAAFLEPGGTGGVARLHELYQEALREGYRFLSYGDAMLIR